MKTKILNSSKIRIASKIIQSGGLVAFPTETVYGLGANGLNKSAVKKIFLAKGRPSDNPLILHISSVGEVKRLVKHIPKKAEILMAKFWPGPLTIVFKKSDLVPNEVTCGLDSVAIRMPKNKIALDLIKRSNCPIAAPSANLSGKPSPTKAEHVVQDLSGKINAIIKGKPSEIGLESTVIDVTKKIPIILRPGKITPEEIKKHIGETRIHQQKIISRPSSPGMKYRHYSPNAKVLVFKNQKEFKRLLRLNKLRKIKVLEYSEEIKMAKNLFNDFREADKRGYELILVKKIKEKGIGRAIMNRLNKARTN